MDLKRPTYVITALILIHSVSLSSQNVNVAGVFPTIDHSGDLADKLEYSFYYFAAFPLFGINKTSTDPYFNLFYSEQALTYKLNSKLSLTSSYVYQRADVVYHNYVNENRFYLQAKYKHALGKANLIHRIRFDGRFVQDRTNNQSPFTHRARYLIGLDFPVNSGLYLIAYEEAFFNTFENPTAVYGENWAYAALGKQLNQKNKIELGALYITWSTGGKRWLNQYYLQATWLTHVDFRKTKP